MNSFAEENQPYWNAKFSFGVGKAAYMNTDTKDLLHGKMELKFYPIENSDSLLGKVLLITQSPLREESGFIQIPPNEREFINIGELWFQLRVFEPLEFKLGTFSDTQDHTTPNLWPFYSAQAAITPINLKQISWKILGRGDIFATYARELNKPTSSFIERNRIESILDIRLPYDVNLYLNTHYNKYSDPDNTLQTLSIGRDQYIEEQATKKTPTYQIANLMSTLGIKINNFYQGKVHFQYWNNLAVSFLNEGYLYGTEHRFFKKTASVTFGLDNFRGQQHSSPALALNSFFYPGTNILSFYTYGSYSFSENWTGLFEFRYQKSKPYGTDWLENNSLQQIPFIPKYKLMLKIEHAINAL